MKTIRPKKLETGDTIGILAVSGRIKEYERIEKAAQFFENRGFKTVISDTCKSSHRYMAGENDEECIKEFHNFFSDKNIDAVLCARGGFGTIRLIDKINWKIVKKNPKIFAGYSDITALLAMIYKKTGLITYHAPMACGDFGAELNDYTINSFFDALTGEKNTFYAGNNIVYKKGKAKGALWGGNLSVLTSLCGINFIPDEDIILFLEDLNEPVYKIDRMLAQLFNINKLKKNVKGIAFGEFLNIDDEKMLDELLKETAHKLNIPVSRGFKITHEKEKDTLPFGAQAEFNADKGSLILC